MYPNTLLLSLRDNTLSEYIDVSLVRYPEPPKPNKLLPVMGWHVLATSGFLKDDIKCQYTFTMQREYVAQYRFPVSQVIEDLINRDFEVPIRLAERIRISHSPFVSYVVFDIRNKEVHNVVA